MVNLMLNNLRGPTGKGFDTSLKLVSSPLNFDSFIALARTGATEQRKATFFGIIRVGFFDNLRVKHRHICTFIIKYNNALAHTNHICCHANTTIFVGNQRV